TPIFRSLWLIACKSRDFMYVLLAVLPISRIHPLFMYGGFIKPPDVYKIAIRQLIPQLTCKLFYQIPCLFNRSLRIRIKFITFQELTHSWLAYELFIFNHIFAAG